MTPRARVLALLLAAPLGLSAGGCGDAVTDPWDRDRAGNVTSIFVTAEGDRGTPAMPLTFSNTGVPYTLRLEARGADGRALQTFNGYVGLSVTPGLLLSIEGDGVLGNYVRLTNGAAGNVRVTVARAYGQVRIWAEDSGYVPADLRGMTPPSCANGRDDDRDGRIDYPADLGCSAANDDSERAGSYVAGTSEPMYFSTPLLSDVQGRSAISPLSGERISVTRGRLVVTRINNSGFYVTDVDDRSCMGRACYNHMFAFNFRAPEGLRPCDTLSLLQGSVSEFVGFTELNQPGYNVSVLWRPGDPTIGECPIPPPAVITPEIVADELQLESLEAGIVRVENMRFPTVMGPGRPMDGIARAGETNCDLNADGRVSFDNGREEVCANACAASADCSEWSAWARFGQVMMTFPTTMGPPRRILITPRDVDPAFNPRDPHGPGTITGTLKQVGPNWIVEPRCIQDLVIAGDGQTILPPNATCLRERTEREE